jgi:hypothetical protein
MPRQSYPSDLARITVTGDAETIAGVRDLARRYFGDKDARAGAWLWAVALAMLEGSDVLAHGVIPAAEAAERLRVRRAP